MIWGEIQVNAEPGEGALMAWGVGLILFPLGGAGRVVLIGNLGEVACRISSCPGGVVKAGIGCLGIGRDAHTPAFVE